LNKLEGVGNWNDARVVVAELRSVITMRVDTLEKSLAAPTVLKIDVEGAEMLVLKGAKHTITKHRPAILVEGPQELGDEMGVFFREHDYVILNGAVDEQSPLTKPVWDTIAVPREKYINQTGAARYRSS
jgi:hypothetical protein